MRFLRYFGIGLVALAAFCSVMVVREFSLQHSQHAELLESLILLQTKGYPEEANRVCQRLIMDLPRSPDKILLEDLQRTTMLIDPAKKNAENLIWRYHASLNNELNRRSERNLARALKTAELK